MTLCSEEIHLTRLDFGSPACQEIGIFRSPGSRISVQVVSCYLPNGFFAPENLMARFRFDFFLGDFH